MSTVKKGKNRDPRAMRRAGKALCGAKLDDTKPHMGKRIYTMSELLSLGASETYKPVELQAMAIRCTSLALADAVAHGDLPASLAFVAAMTRVLQAGLAGTDVLQKGGDPVAALAAMRGKQN